MLNRTYENCQSSIGLLEEENDRLLVPLLPICHTTQMAQVEIVIDQNGNFIQARVVPKKDARTIIPCTESSNGRTNGEAPHGLCDKIQYIAKDYKEFGGEKKHYFNSYYSQLKKWCESDFSNPKAQAVLNYIEKGVLVKDLVKYKVLFVGLNGKLIEKWEENKDGEKPEIFSVLKNLNQTDVFVRWIIWTNNENETKTWMDKELFQSWIDFYSSTKITNGLCYASGETSMLADMHPYKIRNDGDSAKIISSNDSSGFTYRGRFLTPEQACGVSFAVTQKAHNALRWLISRQGYRSGDQAIVAWATTGNDTPNPMEDTISLFPEAQSDSEPIATTTQEFAKKLNIKMAGYRSKLGDTTDVVIMGLNSASPGRLSITYYRELKGSDFLSRIENWHKTCCWFHDYSKKDVLDNKTGKLKPKNIRFIGAPSLKDIAEGAYGRIDEKLRKSTIDRLLPCIIDGQKVPLDIINMLVHRASNKIGLEHWEWQKTLSITCAMYKKFFDKEKFDMALEESRKTRDYLYGRLLALADSLESWALSESNEKRPTTATRFMQRFAEHPYTTWRNIELALTPYKARLGGKATNRLRILTEIMTKFEPNEFNNDKKLSGEFLLGYHCQLDALQAKHEKEKKEDDRTS